MSMAFQVGSRLVWASLLCGLIASQGLAEAPAAKPAVAQANAVFQAGRADEAEGMVRAVLAADSRDAGAHQLLCRIDYSENLVDDALQECETAVSIDSHNSDSQMWLGRAIGMKATHANLIAAYGLAKRVRDAFEAAVNLDPKNVPALSDLGEFYVAAPGMVGGGLDKAAQLSQRMMGVSPTKAHRLLAEIAEKKGDMAMAEAEFKMAVDSGRPPEAYVDLGHFYQRRNRLEESEATLKLAVREDETHGRMHDWVLVDAASILTAAQRDPAYTAQLLREYLGSPAKSEAAPAYKVYVQLGNLLASDGDKEGARREYGAALALASKYSPAKRALQRL